MKHPATKRHITAQTVEAALSHIPPNLPRDDWSKIGMAIKSEFPSEDGFALFDAWSSAADGYNAKSVRDTWRSIKAGGGVAIGTLLHIAKEHGFDIKANAPPVANVSAENAAKEQARREQLAKAEAVQKLAANEAAAVQARSLWDAANTEGDSAYLTRKGIGAYGVRFGAGGSLLVPMRDDAGALWNVQTIAPVKPKTGTDKLYLKGGKKSGLWHTIGSIEGADVVLIAEGYATAASLHEATGHAVVMAFDAGNLSHVAKAIRRQAPAALLVLCADNDKATEARTGTNTGTAKAIAAAKSVGGVYALPNGLPDGQSDFNDLHLLHGGAAGLTAVRDCVNAAIHAHTAQRQKDAVRVNTSVGITTSKPPPDTRETFDVYEVSDTGIWHVGVETDGKRKPPMWICSRLDVLARTSDLGGNGWGYLLEFADPLGHVKQWAMPSRMLSGDGNEFRSVLLGMGLRIAPSPVARNMLSQYVQTRAPSEFAKCTDRIGWHGRAFVYPHETVGASNERIVFQSDSAMENTFSIKGELAEWRDRVGALCAGNSRLVFSVSCAFAASLLRPAGVESGGFHFRGDSSSGKTTALKVAASVNGGSSYLQRWRTTDNALEAIAAQHSDALLILDELAQVDPKTAGECAYMLANEQSKARSTRTGTPRARLSWRLLFLSAGELGLADHMAEGMKRARTGQEVRMVDIPADAGKGLGAFENLHGDAGGAMFSRRITQAATAKYGSAGRAFIEWACTESDALPKRVKQGIAAFLNDHVPSTASGQVQRVGARFAIVAVAGELATEAGITGWQAGESIAAAKACYHAWLDARGGTGNGEIAAMLKQVRKFLELHGAGRFTWWHRGADDHAPNTLSRAGFRRMLTADGEPIKTNSQHGAEYGEKMNPLDGEMTSTEYFILDAVFKTEICQGFDSKAVCAALVAHGCLVSGKDQFATVKRLPSMGTARCFHITAKIFEIDL